MRRGMTLLDAVFVGSLLAICTPSKFAWAADQHAPVAALSQDKAADDKAAQDKGPQENGAEDKKPEQLINELFVGEKIYRQDKGEINLVLSPSFAKTNDGKETEFSAEFKYGLTERLQLTAEVPVHAVDPDVGHQHSGVGDINLSVSYNFYQADNFAIGVRSVFLLPTGDEHRNLGGGAFVWTPELLSSARIGKAEIYAGIGAQISDNRRDAVTYSLAGAYPWQKFVGVLEFSGNEGRSIDELYAVPGLYWCPSEHFSVGAGVPIGLTHGSDDYRVVVKVIFEF